MKYAYLCGLNANYTAVGLENLGRQTSDELNYYRRYGKFGSHCRAAQCRKIDLF